MLQTTSKKPTCKRRSFCSCATSILRGWFIAIGYQIPFEDGLVLVLGCQIVYCCKAVHGQNPQTLQGVRDASVRAITVPERCLKRVQPPHLLFAKIEYLSILIRKTHNSVTSIFSVEKMCSRPPQSRRWGSGHTGLQAACAKLPREQL